MRITVPKRSPVLRDYRRSESNSGEEFDYQPQLFVPPYRCWFSFSIEGKASNQSEELPVETPLWTVYLNQIIWGWRIEVEAVTRIPTWWDCSLQERARGLWPWNFREANSQTRLAAVLVFDFSRHTRCLDATRTRPSL